MLIEFDSVEQAPAAHDSAAYQEALAALDGGAVRDLRIGPEPDPGRNPRAAEVLQSPEGPTGAARRATDPGQFLRTRRAAGGW